MNLRQRIVEAPPGLQWHLWRVLTRVLLRPTFAQLGERTVIAAPRNLRGVDRIRVGADCAIYPGVWLQAEEAGSLTIGDRVNIAHGAHLHAWDPVTLGSDCMIGAGSLIISAEHTHDDRHAIAPSGPITLGDAVFVGERATILGGVTIGDRATIGAATVVTRDVPADAILVGAPARLISGSER